MNIGNDYLLIGILVVAVVTFATRLMPFIFFGKNKQTPLYVHYIGTYLPPAVMAMLVIYSLRHLSLVNFPFGIPEFLGVLIVFALHQWKRNTLLSIIGGTVAYMLMVQLIF